MSTSSYRFRVVSGPNAGKLFTVDERGALLGRSENCDVIILDPSLSRHHCRIFVRDGLLWVADLKSANCTQVDGVPIQEAPLWKDRRISIGDTVILVESDTGAKPPESTPAAFSPDNKQRNRAIVGGSVLVLALLLLGIIVRPRPTPVVLPPPTPVVPPETMTLAPPAITPLPQLAMDYHRIHASTDNVYTLHMQILPPDTATIQIDDPAANRQIHRTITMPRDQLERLAQRFIHADFFSITNMATAEDTGEQIRISALVGNRHHVVRNTLAGAPASFRNLSRFIEETAATVFGAWIADVSDDNLIQLASQHLAAAHTVIAASQTDRQDQLYTAIQDLQEALWLIERFFPEPDIATDIRQTLQQTRDILDNQIREILAEADQAALQQDRDKEMTALQDLMQNMPDVQDDRHKTAATRLARLLAEGDTQDPTRNGGERLDGH